MSRTDTCTNSSDCVAFRELCIGVIEGGKAGTTTNLSRRSVQILSIHTYGTDLFLGTMLRQFLVIRLVFDKVR